MKSLGEDMQTERWSTETNNEATDLVGDPVLDHEAIALLAYLYWEASGCPHDSTDENWFRAEAALRNRLAAAATD